MADGVGFLDQLRSLAEVGVGAGGVHHGFNLAAPHDRPGKHSLARFALRGQGLTCKCGLVHLDRIARQQPRIRRHDVAQAQADDVARRHFTRRRVGPLSIAFHPGLDRQFGLQGSDGVARLAFLPESNYRVRNQQEKDDEEIRPMPDHA